MEMWNTNTPEKIAHVHSYDPFYFLFKFLSFKRAKLGTLNLCYRWIVASVRLSMMDYSKPGT